MTAGLASAPDISITRAASGGARRGACPTLREPMRTGDGLLARIRVVGGRLTPSQLSQLAHLAAQHGNGLVEVTARGNLQVRGLSQDSAGPFAAAVSALLPLETGLVVDLSPLAGAEPGEIADPGPLAAAIRAGAAPMLDRLGPKVSVVIDNGGQFPLGGLKADVHLIALTENRWAVMLGESKPQSTDAEGAVATTLALLGALAAIGPDARATDLFPAHRPRPAATDNPPPPGPWRRQGVGTGILELADGHTTCIALPFGSIRSDSLMALCDAASGAGVTTIRLAPDHLLLIDKASDTLIARAADLGFITRAEDPRRRISACIGSRGCPSGHIPAREIAGQLATHLRPGQHLHVSGCAKGCAHPRPTDITVVGAQAGIGLVFDGRAGDTPDHILDEAKLADALVAHQGRQ